MFAIAIERPDGKEILGSPGTLIERRDSKTVDGCIGLTTGVVSVEPAFFHEAGTHHVVVRVGETVIHREPFGVFLLPV